MRGLVVRSGTPSRDEEVDGSERGEEVDIAVWM